MKTYKNQIILVIIVLILILLLTVFLFKSEENPNDKNKIISLQEEKIKLLEDKLNNQKNWNKVEEKPWLIWDWEENLWKDLNISKIYDEAVSFSKNKEYEKAIKNFKLVIKLKPDSLNAYNKLAMVYYNMKDYDNQIKVFREILKTYPEKFEYYGYIWGTYNKYNHIEEYNLYLLISSLLYWKDFDKQGGIFKKYYDLESKNIKKFIKNKEYTKLRDYIFKKYPDDKKIEINVKNNNNLDLTNNLDNNYWDFYKLAVEKSKKWKDDEAIKLYKKTITFYSKNDSKYASKYGLLSWAWNNLWFNYKATKDENAEIICFLISKALWTRYDQTINATENQKKIILLEQETINEFINNKEYNDLRRYIFNKYLWEVIDEYNIENNNLEKWNIININVIK